MRHAEVKARFQRFGLYFFIWGEKRIGEEKRKGMEKSGGGGIGGKSQGYYHRLKWENDRFGGSKGC